MREDIFVEEGMRRASLRSRSTEKAHFAVEMSVYRMGNKRDRRKELTPNKIHSITERGKIQHRV
jgi:hypothetical protein